KSPRTLIQVGSWLGVSPLLSRDAITFNPTSRNRIMHRPLLLCSTASALGCASTARTPEVSTSRLDRAKAATEAIRAEDIQRDVSYLAADANMGRRTPFPDSPSPGFDSAAAYVARLLKELGVRPMGDNGTFFQHYTVTRSTLDTTKVTGSIGGDPMKWGDDFVINQFLLPGVREANVVYVGNGIGLLKQGVDPYAGLDIKWKWLLVYPWAGNGGRAAGGGVLGIDFTNANEVARRGGAMGMLFVPSVTGTRQAPAHT